MRLIKVLILFIIFILLVAVLTQNLSIFKTSFDVGLDLYFYKTPTYNVANILLMVISLIIGLILALLFGACSSSNIKKKLKEKDKEIKELKNRSPEPVSTYSASETISSEPHEATTSDNPFKSSN